MGWAISYDDDWRRDVGYGVPAFCDHPRCDKVIDRGLSYVCGGEPYGGDRGCGLFFCGDHLRGLDRCIRCYHRSPKGPYPAKPDHPDWVHHKATDPSWAAWRAEQSTPTPEAHDGDE